MPTPRSTPQPTPPTRTPPARWCAAALLVAVLAGGTACSPAEDDAAPAPYAPPTATASVPVIQPGMPGEPARTVAPEDAAPPVDGERWSEADAAFVQQMVTHHRQAVEMSALAVDRAGDPDVAAIAERIGLGQEPEVQVMEAWLEQRGQDAPPERSWLTGRGEVAGGDAGHEHHGAAGGAMAGMASEAEVQQLAASRGPDFDALFVDLMVRHHRGALAMVAEHAGSGVDLQVREMADEMSAVQTAEIAHLEGLRPA